ncbi:DUF1837 domain-containing protein [Rhodopseudomonas sp. P1]|uniref:HamA C-terminal domain-containing protein n=1 Tax=Rhodopseudomonas sp. P1 TaxID=3434357 RepID=UPI0031FC5968
MPDLVFEILIDDTLSEIASADHLRTVLNKRILSLINDFEDAKWRYSKFQSFLWDNVAETALSRRERLALVNRSHSSLVAAARNLRLTDNDEVGQGSEIAEVFLYGLMHHRFGALPVVPKIFYKQNSQDNAKGADSVHIVLSEDDFTLWFGEAKFYNSIADARLDAIVKSVMNSLSTDKLKKENSIITNVSDLDEFEMSPRLREKIKAALDNRESIDNLKSRIHIPILLLHECTATATATELTPQYREEIIAFHKSRAETYFAKQLEASGHIHKYNELNFHIILFPVPSKVQIVETFVEAATFYKRRQ